MARIHPLGQPTAPDGQQACTGDCRICLGRFLELGFVFCRGWHDCVLVIFVLGVTIIELFVPWTHYCATCHHRNQLQQPWPLAQKEKLIAPPLLRYHSHTHTFTNPPSHHCSSHSCNVKPPSSFARVTLRQKTSTSDRTWYNDFGAILLAKRSVLALFTCTNEQHKFVVTALPLSMCTYLSTF